jgi:hypothetical protein
MKDVKVFGTGEPIPMRGAIMKSAKAILVGRILTALVSFPFIFSGVGKLFPSVFFPQMSEQMAQIGLPESILLPIAILELLCVVLYLIPATSVLGAVLFTGYLGGAILTHLRVGQNVALQVILGMVIWLGIYLREPRLHNLLPLRKQSS